jgi:ubiquinone/menaquinone biosynthesis C-methylase UbiE
VSGPEGGAHERRYGGGADRLRSPERLAMLELPRVVSLCLDGMGGSSALDVGTGSGLFAEAFSAAGLESTGLDVNEELLAAARDKVPSCRFVEGVAELLPFPDASFDLVFMGLVLHKADDAAAVLREARRVARRLVAVLEWPYRQEAGGPPIAHRLAPETIARLASEAGFLSVEAIRLDRLDLYKLR